MNVRLGALFVALVCALGGAACGSDEQDRADGDERKAVVTSDALMADFGAATGKPALRRQGGSQGKFEQLGLGLDPPPDLLRRYGVFSIYVVEPGETKAKTALLTDKTTGKPLEPDENGIYWEYDDHSRTWIANATYGENAVLVWFSEKRKRVTDARWDRLHEFMTESTAA